MKFSDSVYFPAVVRVEPSDNGAVYKCFGENSATSSVIKAVVSLNVHCKFSIQGES